MNELKEEVIEDVLVGDFFDVSDEELLDSQEAIELLEALKAASPFIRAYIRLKLLTGLRRGDLLSLRLSDLKDDGIHVTPSKTVHSSGKKMIYEWSDELRDAVNGVLKQRKKILSVWLFHTSKGQPYLKPDGTANGFDSIWQRFMAKAIDQTGLVERFTEHDLRAKVGSEAEPGHARQLLGHASDVTTNRIYRRKPEIVKPAK
ncbi:MAG: tyrosine-type recombinase/integrase [Gammaproteobacteria bacterium]|nr:tyrosine-type recombinase/integrase [Pseudomonadales bacterium]